MSQQTVSIHVRVSPDVHDLLRKQAEFFTVPVATFARIVISKALSDPESLVWNSDRTEPAP